MPATEAILDDLQAPPEQSDPAPDPFDISQMLESPEMKEMMRAQHRMMMDQTYGELFDSLALPDPDREAFKDLLTDKMTAVMDAGMAVWSASAGGESPEVDAEKLTAMTDRYDEQIKTLLGNDDYEVFRQYESTQHERQQVDLFKQSLGGDDAMTWEQEHELILAMHEERQASPPTSGIDPTAFQLPDSLSDERVEQQLLELDAMHGRHLMRAA